MDGKSLPKILWWAILPLTLLVVAGILLHNADAYALRSDPGYLTHVGPIARQGWFRLGFYLHIFTAVPVVLIGWLQFSSALRQRRPTWHRNIGKAYVLLTLFAAAPGGFILALGAAGGLPGKASFIAMSILWFATTLRAWRRILRGDIPGHQRDMQRSYALSFAAITLRLWTFLIGGLIGWHTPEAYALCAWLCWVPNLGAIELWRRWG